MAHPYAKNRSDLVSHNRVKEYMKGYASGGAVKAYKAGGAVAPAKKAGGGEVKVPALATGGRLDKFARGGGTKKKPETQINIAVVQPSKDSPPETGSTPAGGALPPPGGLPPPPPAAGPPPHLQDPWVLRDLQVV